MNRKVQKNSIYLKYSCNTLNVFIPVAKLRVGPTFSCGPPNEKLVIFQIDDIY